MKIYIAYRYSANNVCDVLSNIGKAIEVGKEIALAGYFPYIPHLDCLLAIFDHKKLLPLEYYYNSSMEFLKVCDAIFIVEHTDILNSKGVKEEYEYAINHGIQVVFSIVALDEYKRTIKRMKETCLNSIMQQQ